MTVHTIRNPDGDPCGTLTVDEPTDTEPGRYIVHQDDTHAIDLWSPTFDRQAFEKAAAGNGFTIDPEEG